MDARLLIEVALCWWISPRAFKKYALASIDDHFVGNIDVITISYIDAFVFLKQLRMIVANTFCFVLLDADLHSTRAMGSEPSLPNPYGTPPI